MDQRQLFSLLLRDFTIIAKTHADLARHYRAVAVTCRRALDATPAHMLPSPVREKDVVLSTEKTLTDPTLPFGV